MARVRGPYRRPLSLQSFKPECCGLRGSLDDGIIEYQSKAVSHAVAELRIIVSLVQAQGDHQTGHHGT